MTKKPSKAPPQPDLVDETTSGMVMTMLGTGLERLETHITTDANLDDESALALAHLLTKVAMVAGELRKAEKAARDADGALTIAQVIEWARRLSASERAQFTRQIQSLNADAGKSGLA